MRIIKYSLIVALMAIAAPACDRNKNEPTTPKPAPVEARNDVPAGNLDERRNQIDDQSPDGRPETDPPASDDTTTTMPQPQPQPQPPVPNPPTSTQPPTATETTVP
jgi:hypothetical protein